MFSAAMAGTVLETGDVKANPFPVALTYVGETENNDSWNYQSIKEHPEFVTRLQTILEDKLQTKIELSIKTRAYTEEERHIRETAKMSPYELDTQKEPGFAKLQKIFAAELVYSVPLKKATVTSAADENEENDN